MLQQHFISIYVPFFEHLVDIKLSILDWFKSKYRKQSLFYFVESQEYRSEAGSTSRRHNLRVVGKKWEVCNSSELRQSSRRQQAFLWSPRTIGTLQLLTNKFLKLLHSHTGSDTAQHILISSSADKELSCQFFSLNFISAAVVTFLHLLSRSNNLRFPQRSEAAQILSLTKWSFIH